MSTYNNVQKQITRKFFRCLRKHLSINEQKYSSKMITKQLLSHEAIVKAVNIALFLSFDGEIDTKPLINELLNIKKNIFLPCICNITSCDLVFLHFNSKTILKKNKFNIYEPKFDINKVIQIEKLDIIIVPLVAFDNNRNRLGMGGGFYDKILTNWIQKKFYPIGIAYDCQRIENICISDWDIQLPEIITPQKIWK